MKPTVHLHMKGDNREAIIKEINRRAELAMCAIGEKAEGYAKDNCPVDTGRLRNSITYATATKQGKPNTRHGGEKSTPEKARGEDYQVKSTPAKNTCYIGTNVEYAAEQEYYNVNGKTHFLRNAACNHGDEYKNILKTILETD